jgi:FtsZ-interacting cell division protein ZipA
MHQLRWTLLILGVLFVMLLAWIERRRQHRGFLDQGPVEHDPLVAPESQAPAFREPTLNLPEMRARDPMGAHELPVVEIEDDSLTARRVEPRPAAMNPPTLSLPVMESGPVKREQPVDHSALSGTQWVRQIAESPPVPRLDTPAPKRSEPKTDTVPPPVAQDEGDEERAFNEDVFGEAAVEPGNETDAALAAEIAAAAEEADFKMEPIVASDSEEPGELPSVEGEATIAQEREAAAESAPPLFTAADVTPIKEPIVDWPPDDRRKVVALRLVAPPNDRLAGRAVRLALSSEGFVLGKFQIFHKPDSSGRAVLSAANLSKPGTFEVETMDSQRFSGLSLFAVLPGPKPPQKAFDDLLSTARNLNERLQGALQDERGGPLTPTRIAALRESLTTEVPP